MFTLLVKKLNEYLNCKGGLNTQEEELRGLCRSCENSYPISCLSRIDLEEKGYNTSDLTNEQMTRMASKMGDAYVENYYWESLEMFAALYNIPQKK